MTTLNSNSKSMTDFPHGDLAGNYAMALLVADWFLRSGSCGASLDFLDRADLKRVTDDACFLASKVKGSYIMEDVVRHTGVEDGYEIVKAESDEVLKAVSDFVIDSMSDAKACIIRFMDTQNVLTIVGCGSFPHYYVVDLTNNVLETSSALEIDAVPRYLEKYGSKGNFAVEFMARRLPVPQEAVRTEEPKAEEPIVAAAPVQPEQPASSVAQPSRKKKQKV